MRRISRRAAAGLSALGIAGAFVATRLSRTARLASRIRRVGPSPILVENALPGSAEWQIGVDGTRAADDAAMQIKGYSSGTSVNVGESLDFFVTTNPAADFTVAIYRLGFYAGIGARHVLTSPMLSGSTQSDPDLYPDTGRITCDWTRSWTVDIPSDWTSGYYLAIFTTTSGWRSLTPFVVRDDNRSADLCVVIPFSTYQAYNQWPRDGRRGKSLYYGYPDSTRLEAPSTAAANSYNDRARQVSFDRPYEADGMPKLADLDHSFIRWAEERGYDLVFASTIDLHNGRLDSSRYAGLVFSGHDEYWSREMREHASAAVDRGTSLLFMTANNVYWNVRIQPSVDGTPDRVVTCFKTSPDPDAAPGHATGQWRDRQPAPNDPEQRLIGVLYNGFVAKPAPLVVRSHDHWFWTGTGVADGDQIGQIVAGEADGFIPTLAQPHDVAQTLLSASPYVRNDGTPNGVERIQNTSVYTNGRGAIVFGAGTLYWPYGLGEGDYEDDRIKRATANVLDRVIGER